MNALMSPKRGSSGAWGTASAGKLVGATGAMWLVMLRIREREVSRDGEALEEECWDGMMKQRRGEIKKEAVRQSGPVAPAGSAWNVT